MKPLKLMAVLIFAILMTPDTFAHCKGKHANDPEHCDSSGGGGGTDAGYVSIEATGYGTAVQDFVVDAFQACEEKLSVSDTSYLCNKRGTDHYIMLGDFLMKHTTYPDGAIAANCFGTAGYFPVTIGVDLNRNKSAEAVIRFGAFKNDRVTQILYVLRVNDPRGWQGESFPPPKGKTTTMGVLDGNTKISWDLGASNRNQERDACVASGTFQAGTDFIRVDFTRID